MLGADAWRDSAEMNVPCCAYWAGGMVWPSARRSLERGECFYSCRMKECQVPSAPITTRYQVHRLVARISAMTSRGTIL